MTGGCNTLKVMRLALFAAAFLGVAACSRSSDAVREFSDREITMPDGRKVTVETMIDPSDMTRGMMFRDSLAPDRGMLFVHGSPFKYPYWMYNVRIPLDIIWLDQTRRVVEISANTPPCKTKASQCPNYGGHENALYVLELAGGMAAKYGVANGAYISF